MGRQLKKAMFVVGTALVMVVGLATAASAQWTPLANPFPSGNTFHCLLLTDGSVICHQYDTNRWHRLVPNQNGSYVNGTWDPNTSKYPNIPNMPNGTDTSVLNPSPPPNVSGPCAPCAYGPRFYSSAVLRDGRVLVIGGEYNTNGNTWTNIGFLYDPVANSWSAQITEPFGTGSIGDAQNTILPNGTLLLANISNAQIATFNPDSNPPSFTALPLPALAADRKTAVASPFARNDEEGWHILPNGLVLAVSANLTNRFWLYNPTTNKWSSGATPVNLADFGAGTGGSQEVGPGVLRPDGTLIYFSGNSSGQNAVYNYAANTWTATGAAGDFPVSSGTFHYAVKDGPAALLPNGNVLVMASPVDTTAGNFNTPSKFFEFNGTNLTEVTAAPNAASFTSYNGSFLVLPTGEVLLAAYDQGSTQTLAVYSNGGGPDDSWRPSITAGPNSVDPGTTFAITGRLFNGFSEGGEYGDDAQMATNYPIIRITNRATGHVFYARTHDHSRMGLEAVGSTESVTTYFDTPTDLESGLSDLEVVVNGIPSLKWVVNGPGLTIPGPVTLETCPGTTVSTILNVCNTGKLNLNINNITSSSPKVTVDNPGYTVVISPDFCFPFQVHYSPTASATTNATLTIASNDPNTPSTDVTFTGTSAAPTATIALVNSGVFANTCTGSFSDAPVLYVTNGGSCPLTITSILSSNPDFLTPTTNPILPRTVPAHDTMTLPIRFQPGGLLCSDTAARTGTITLNSDDPANPAIATNVSGLVPCPHINATIANTGSFGNVCAGNQSDLSLQLINQGQCNLNITSVAVGNPANFIAPSVSLPLILSHDANVLLPIRFKPDPTQACSDTVARTSTVTIGSNDPGTPSLVTNVSGIEGCPKIVLSPQNLTGLFAFPATVSDPTGNLGCYTDRQITITNAGICPLNISSVTAGPSNTFNVVNPSMPITIGPGAAPVPVTVRFKPTNLVGQLSNAPDEQTGTLSIVSNDPVGPSAILCGEPVTRSGIRVLVTNGASVPINPLKSLVLSSSGLSPQFKQTLSPAPVVTSASICGNPPILYHLDNENLPPAGTTGSNPKASYTLQAQNNSKPLSTSFTLGQCEMKTFVIQYK